MDLFSALFRSLVSRVPTLERPEIEVTEERGAWADSMFGNLPRNLTPREEQLMRGWE